MARNVVSRRRFRILRQTPPARGSGAKEFRTDGPPATCVFHRTVHKRIHHLVVGFHDLDSEAMEFPAHPGPTLLA
jgi:hypothetical protein